MSYILLMFCVTVNSYAVPSLTELLREFVKQPTEFTSEVFNGHVYLLSHIPPFSLDVDVFERYCLRMGGYLAEVDSEDEYHFLLDFLKDSIPGVRETVYVGAVYDEEEDVWKYIHSGKTNLCQNQL